MRCITKAHASEKGDLEQHFLSRFFVFFLCSFIVSCFLLILRVIGGDLISMCFIRVFGRRQTVSNHQNTSTSNDLMRLWRDTLTQNILITKNANYYTRFERKKRRKEKRRGEKRKEQIKDMLIYVMKPIFGSPS